jgi:hypothetical protein
MAMSVQMRMGLSSCGAIVMGVVTSVLVLNGGDMIWHRPWLKSV